MRQALSPTGVMGDRGFESISLQRGVSCEPDSQGPADRSTWRVRPIAAVDPM
jgi:hypothetical protein